VRAQQTRHRVVDSTRDVPAVDRCRTETPALDQVTKDDSPPAIGGRQLAKPFRMSIAEFSPADFLDRSLSSGIPGFPCRTALGWPPGYAPGRRLGDPVPGILELLPYRKNDGTACGDARNAPYFAGHGYAVVRVDIRGTGTPRA